VSGRIGPNGLGEGVGASDSANVKAGVAKAKDISNQTATAGSRRIN